MRRRLRDARGMTLMELMVVLLVFSLVSGAIFSLLFTSLKAYWKGDLTTQAQQGGRIGMDRLTRELRQARRLFDPSSAVTQGGFTFTTTCSPPQISFVMPHIGPVTLADGSTIQATDPNPVTNVIPYDGSYVSYYLAGAQGTAPGSTTPNTAGPYLQRTVWNIASSTLTTQTIAGDVTALGLLAGGSCPTKASREITVTVTASQTAAGQNLTSTDVVKSDVVLRNL
jgi:prepilin-type N-terminal cleavage/methylation domain-containing protein